MNIPWWVNPWRAVLDNRVNIIVWRGTLDTLRRENDQLRNDLAHVRLARDEALAYKEHQPLSERELREIAERHKRENEIGPQMPAMMPPKPITERPLIMRDEQRRDMDTATWNKLTAEGFSSDGS